MANFNETDRPISTPDQTRASQGYKDDALGGLFSGIAEDFQAGIKATDDFLGRRVADSARDMVEPLRDAAIGNVAGMAARAPVGADLGAGQATPVVDPETGEIVDNNVPVLPAEGQAQFNRLGNIRQGVKAGSLSDSYYRSQLDVVSKKLRSMYPGYEDAIDNNLEKLTGSIPANKLLSDLQTQASAALSASGSAQGKIQTEWMKHVNDGTLDSKLHPLSSINSMQDIANIVSPAAIAKASRSIDDSVIANRKAKNEEYASDTEKRSNNGASNIVTGIMSDIHSPMGKQFSDWMTKLNSMDTNTPWTKDEALQLDNMTNSVVAGARAKLSAYYNGPVGEGSLDTRASILGPEKTKAQIDSQVARLTEWMGDLKDKNSNKLTHQAALTSAWTEGDQAEKLSDPDSLRLHTINTLFGSTVAGNFVSGPEGAVVMGNLGVLASDHATLGIANGDYDSLDSALKDAYNPKISPTQRKAVGDNIVNVFQKALHDPNTPPVLKSRTIMAMYGPNNEKMITSNVPLYQKMSDATTLADIKKYSDDTGRPELWNAAKNWVLKTGTQLGMTQAVQMQNALVYNKLGTIQYHPDTHSFQYIRTSGGITDPSLNDAQTLTANTIQKLVKDPAAEAAVNTYNKMVSGMVSIFKLDNPKTSSDNINTYVANLTKSLGVDLGAAKQPDGVTTFFGAMNEAATRAFPKGALYGPNGFFHPDGQGGLQLTYTRNAEGQIVPRAVPGNQLITNPAQNGSIGGAEAAGGTTQIAPPGTFQGDNPAVGGRGGARMPLGASDLTAEGLPGGGQGGSSPPTHNPLYGASPVEARQGLLQDIKEMTSLYNSTEEPGQKAEFKKDLDSLMQEYRTMRQPPVPGSSDVGFKPRGNPVAVNTPETQAQGKEGLDVLTGIPSLVDALKSGNPKEIAKQVVMAAATVIPFPAGKVAKGVSEAVEGGAKILDMTATKAATIDKVIDTRSALYDALGLPRGIQDIAALPTATVEKAAATLKLAVNSKGIKPEEKKAIQSILDEIDTHLASRETTPAMQKLEDLRTEKLSDKINDMNERRSEHLANTLLPEEIGQKLDQFKMFKKHSTDADNIKGYDKEIKLLERAREIHRERIKPVK